MSIWLPVKPMLATAAPRPPTGDEWAFEVKWDGYRTLAFVDAGSARLQSRSGRDVTDTYSEVAVSVREQTYATTVVLDGELVAIDENGKPNFGALQAGQTASLYVFDVLRIDDHDTVSLTYLERRRLLAEIAGPGGRVAVPDYRIGNGAELADSTRDDGLEGVVAKQIDSTYQIGTRSSAWRKIKHRRTMTVTVGGYTLGSGARSASIGAVLVGSSAEDDRGGLRFRGAIGTGFDEPTLAELRSVLDGLRTDECPFDPPPDLTPPRESRWVAPVLEMVVSMSELSAHGHIRHGSFIGWHAPGGDSAVGE